VTYSRETLNLLFDQRHGNLKLTNANHQAWDSALDGQNFVINRTDFFELRRDLQAKARDDSEIEVIVSEATMLEPSYTLDAGLPGVRHHGPFAQKWP
jgi:hypothetical protein